MYKGERIQCWFPKSCGSTCKCSDDGFVTNRAEPKLDDIGMAWRGYRFDGKLKKFVHNMVLLKYYFLFTDFRTL